MSTAIHSVVAFGMAMSVQRRQRRAGEEIRTAPPETRPGSIRVVADQRLNDQTGDRPREANQRHVIERSAEILEDSRGVRLRQRETELDAESPQANAEDMP